MFYKIIVNTPVWVWGIFALLGWLGVKQSQPSTPGIRRITLIPLAMLGLSLYGVVSRLGAAADTLAIWSGALLLVAWVTVRQPLSESTRFNAWTQRFELPGSWTPLVLMMGIFITKYAVGVTAVIQPDVLHSAAVSYSICAIYGACSGVFSGRAMQLWRLACGHTCQINTLKGA